MKIANECHEIFPALDKVFVQRRCGKIVLAMNTVGRWHASTVAHGWRSGLAGWRRAAGRVPCRAVRGALKP